MNYDQNTQFMQDFGELKANVKSVLFHLEKLNGSMAKQGDRIGKLEISNATQRGKVAGIAIACSVMVGCIEVALRLILKS